MKLTKILELEKQSRHKIHLNRQGYMWYAYERSAYYFINHIIPYTVCNRKGSYNKNIKEIVWISFPVKVLDKIKKIAGSKGFQIQELNPHYIIINDIPKTNGFNVWKESVSADSKIIGINKNPRTLNNGKYLLQKLTFEFSKYILQLVEKFKRDYKFSIGERLQRYALDIGEEGFLIAINLKNFDKEYLIHNLMKIRINLRESHQLHLISTNQWISVNKQIEEMLLICYPKFAKKYSTLFNIQSLTSK